jgi:3',5'-cyclic AMP phosphodiesterase CpdA
VAEQSADIEWALTTLQDRFGTVVWAPGNHELWTPRDDPLPLRGEARYQHLVEMCRRLGVHTPEDPYPVWDGPGGPVTVVPLFTLYDYTFLPDGASTKEEALVMAYQRGVVCTDEMLLHPDPHPSRQAWCEARLVETERRLSTLDGNVPVVFVNHWPLVREPTRVLWYPEFAQWCGSVRTADWHVRHRTEAVVYGHLHIPRTTWYDGVRFEEVSVGYPREWRRRGPAPNPPRPVLPAGVG